MKALTLICFSLLAIAAQGHLPFLARQNCPNENYKNLFIVGGYGPDGSTLIQSTETITLSSSGGTVGSVSSGDFLNDIGGAVGANFPDSIGILICGGIDDNDNTAVCNSFKDNNWSPASPMSIPRAFAWGVRLNAHQWWVTGGIQEGYDNGVDSTEIFDDTTGDWTAGTALPEPNGDHCIVIINSTTAMLMGGKTPASNGYSSKSYFFNLDTKEWIPTGDLNIGRNGFSCGVFETCEGQKMVYAAGGYTDGYINTDSVEYFALEEGSQGSLGVWTQGAPLPAPLAYTVVADELHMVGGVDVNGVSVGDVHELNVDTLTWSVMPDVQLVVERNAPAIVVL